MALDQLALSANVTWALSRAVTGFDDVTQGAQTLSFALSGLSLTTWSELFAAQYTIAAAGTQTVDLRSFTDLPGNAVTATKALGILVVVTGAAADRLKVEPHGTNPLTWFFGGTTPSVSIPGGGCLFFSEPAAGGATVSATVRQLLLTNTGAASLTVTVVVPVSTV